MLGVFNITLYLTSLDSHSAIIDLIIREYSGAEYPSDSLS